VGVFVFVLLLWAIVPGLLYLIGWGVSRYTKKAPSWIGFPAARTERGDKQDDQPPTSVGT
jgi:hypothetical protein